MTSRSRDLLAVGLGVTLFALAAGGYMMLNRSTGDGQLLTSAGTGEVGSDSPGTSVPVEATASELLTTDEGSGSSDDGSAGDGAVGALVASQPEDGAVEVALEPSFRLQFDTPLLTTAPAEAVYQISRPGSAADIGIDPVTLTLDLTRNNLSFSAAERLQPSTSYVLTVSGLATESGQPVDPVEIAFTTTAGQPVSDRFTSEKVLDVRGPTTVVLGPDGHLYVSTFEGRIIRVGLNSEGQPDGVSETVVSNDAYHFIGLAFDPGDANVIWVSQWSKNPSDEFGSEIVSYDLSSGAERKRVTGLPRHPGGDHSVQSLVFNAGKLYASVGSVTTSGHESFSFWGEPTLQEVPVSASIIEIDYAELTGVVEIGDRAISNTSAPVRLFATGLRNAYDLAWHRNGNLYANVNQNGGSDEQSTRTPVDGPCVGLPESVQTNVLADTLNLVRRGGYYGHPNPSRGECIVMGGGQEPFAVSGYDPGQAPEAAFDASLIVSYQNETGSSFGVSVNGLAEYLGAGPLDGALLSADFSGSRSILVAKPASVDNMTLAEPISTLSDSDGVPFTFIHPLDVTSSRSGVVYVADFGQWPGTDIGAQGAIHVLAPLPQ